MLFSARTGADRELTLPCGACLGCRLARARAWSLRCVHEASLSEFNCFITLTYAPSHLPPGGSLRYRDFQLFMKRLRRRFPKERIRYFVVGEYGEQLSRPHYHVCLFGFRFPDERPLSLLGASSGFSSAILDSLWGLGHCHVTSLNRSTAEYAARYCLKKITGQRSVDHYRRVDSDGVVYNLVPEFARMSLRPGIGSGWFDRFGDDAIRARSIVHDGAQFAVPKYYDRLLERSRPDVLSSLKEDREVASIPHRWNNSPGRLVVREEVKRAELSSRVRSYETGRDGNVR